MLEFKWGGIKWRVEDLLCLFLPKWMQIKFIPWHAYTHKSSERDKFLFPLRIGISGNQISKNEYTLNSKTISCVFENKAIETSVW